MILENGSITLRDTQLDDVQRYIRWHTEQIEWMDWDAPWEKEEHLDLDYTVSSIKARVGQYAPGSRRWRMEIDLRDDKGDTIHIGWLSSYDIDGEDRNRLAVGIDIPETAYRGSGNGTRALSCWMNYLFGQEGRTALYTQTWSGNLRMIGLAKKLGFEECGRRRGVRKVRGEDYDALTFVISKEKFFAYNEGKLPTPEHS